MDSCAGPKHPSRKVGVVGIGLKSFDVIDDPGEGKRKNPWLAPTSIAMHDLAEDLSCVPTATPVRTLRLSFVAFMFRTRLLFVSRLLRIELKSTATSLSRQIGLQAVAFEPSARDLVTLRQMPIPCKERGVRVVGPGWLIIIVAQCLRALRRR